MDPYNTQIIEIRAQKHDPFFSTLKREDSQISVAH